MSGTKRGVPHGASGQAKRPRAEKSSSSASTTTATTAASSSSAADNNSRLQSLYADQFASQRATELQIFVDGASPVVTGLRAYQTLPRHKRRRAMAHNVNRVPQRLRERARLEMHEPKNVSKPVRKYRRRQLRIVRDHARRQVDKRWLEV
jgi:ribonuclease P/MRP protein subunit POP1